MNKRTPNLRPTVAIALAACAFQLPAAEGDVIELQVFPAGEFLPCDGREMKVPAWRIDTAIASRVIERFRARKTPLVIDYEHQTLHKEKNGQPAPAAAWFRDLIWREGKGLYATAKLTAAARQAIADDQYLYFSPIFTYAVPSGEVLELRMGALTNTPGIDGMEPLEAQAAATFGLTTPSEIPVNELLKKLLALLGLPEDGTEEQAMDAISALKAKPKDAATDAAALCAVLDLKADTPMAELVAVCTSLKAKAEGNSAEYVPMSVFDKVKTDLAALTAQHAADKVDKVVKDGLATGKLLPAEEKWARDLGKTNFAALTSYLEVTPAIAALTATQTGGKPPQGEQQPANLTAEELAVCTNMGLEPADFAANKGA